MCIHHVGTREGGREGEHRAVLRCVGKGERDMMVSRDLSITSFFQFQVIQFILLFHHIAALGLNDKMKSHCTI